MSSNNFSIFVGFNLSLNASFQGNKNICNIPRYIWQYGADKPFINILKSCMTLKRGSWSPKSSPCPNNVSVLRPCVTLKIKSRSQQYS